MVKATAVITRALRKIRLMRQARKLRRQGVYYATLYYEHCDPGYNIHPGTPVEVFGEFSEMNPWGVRVPCPWDPRLKCYKTTVKIRVGQQFKFILDHGRHYSVSRRYCIVEEDGNRNNQFLPSKIRWSDNERKKPRRLLNSLLMNTPAYNKNLFKLPINQNIASL